MASARVISASRPGYSVQDSLRAIDDGIDMGELARERGVILFFRIESPLLLALSEQDRGRLNSGGSGKRSNACFAESPAWVGAGDPATRS